MDRYDRPNAERYRAQAAKCAAIAEKATDPLIKAFSKATADSWLRLAELVEKQSPSTSVRTADADLQHQGTAIGLTGKAP
jgi:hypothetical protein